MDGPGRVLKFDRPNSLGNGYENGNFLEAGERGHQIEGQREGRGMSTSD